MLSSGYFRYRWSYYRPIFERGADPGALCRIDAEAFPVRVIGEDAREYIPYAVHSEITKAMMTSARRLHDYTERYVVNAEKVSAHQLPVPDAVSRAMMQHLRAIYPHLPSHLLHHWCADPHGGVALHQLLHGLWGQAGRQQQDGAPWMVAINILLLKLLRATIAQLPESDAGQADHVVTRVIGAAYLWSLQRFLEKEAEQIPRADRMSEHEALIISATPISFFPRQEEGMLADAPHLILSYGLEPDLAPRMRDVMRTDPTLPGKELLARLASDRLGDHMLKRSWARLCLWDLAASSGQGSWMRWALDGKRLDQLLTRTKELSGVLESALEPLRGHLFADWLSAQMRGDRGAEQMTPWREDLRTLMAFRVFDADVRVETARRKAERVWLDRYDPVVGKGRGDEANRALDRAFQAGKVVLLQPDFERPLHGGNAISSRQACLRIDWTDYLEQVRSLRADTMQDFLNTTFMPATLRLLEEREGVFLDEYGASGCQLRGEPFALLRSGVAMRRLLQNWSMEMRDNDAGDANLPVLSICMSLAGDWSVASSTHTRFGKLRLAYAPALGQAVSGVRHGTGPLPVSGRESVGRPLGGVQCTGGVLDNRGFALTGEALEGIVEAAKGSVEVVRTVAKKSEAQAVLPGYLLPDGDFQVILIREDDGGDAAALIARVGEAVLAGESVDLFEVLDADAPVARLIVANGLPKWAASS